MKLKAGDYVDDIFVLAEKKRLPEKKTETII